MNLVNCVLLWAGRWAGWAANRALEDASRVGVKPIEEDENETDNDLYDQTPPEHRSLADTVFRRHHY